MRKTQRVQRKRFLGYINSDEEVVVDKVTGRVYAKEKFDIHGWAHLMSVEAYCHEVVFDFSADDRVTIARSKRNPMIKPGIAICNPTDKNDIHIGMAIAYCRLMGEPIPEEIYN